MSSRKRRPAQVDETVETDLVRRPRKSPPDFISGGPVDVLGGGKKRQAREISLTRIDGRRRGLGRRVGVDDSRRRRRDHGSGAGAGCTTRSSRTMQAETRTELATHARTRSGFMACSLTGVDGCGRGGWRRIGVDHGVRRRNRGRDHGRGRSGSLHGLVPIGASADHADDDNGEDGKRLHRMYSLCGTSTGRPLRRLP